MADNNKTIITRIQNRRGLKQDLPKPLRPGEIGFATDTRQVYIGADTSVTSDSFNKTAKFENTVGAKTITTDLVNDQIVYFKVPHRRYNRNFFDGTVSSVTWTPQSNAIATSTSEGLVFKTGETEFRDLQQGGSFSSSSMTVVKNGVTLLGDAAVGANHANISSGKDFFFSSGQDSNSVHQISFRTPPVQGDEIGIAYYSNVDVWDAITEPTDVGTGGIGATGVEGFHASYNIPAYRYLDSENIRLSASTGDGYIALSPKHIIVASDVKNTPVAVPFYSSIPYNTLGTFLVSRNIKQTTSSPMTVAASNVQITVGTEHISNFTGSGGFVNANLTTGAGWIDGKVLTVTGLTSTAVNAILPSNSATVTRGVKSIEDYSGNVMTFFADDVTNISTNDQLFFLDESDKANIDQTVGTVTSVNAVTRQVLANISGVLNNDWPGVEHNVFFITRKQGVVTNIVIKSVSHGFDDGETFTTTNGDIGVGNISVANTTSDTFIITTTANIAADTTFTITPVVTDASVFATPVTGVDIASNTSLSQAVTHFNEQNDEFEMRYVSGSVDSIYLTEAENITKNSTGFRIYDDEKATATYLNLTPDNYTKNNSTVKAKLENWLTAMLNNNKINMFKSLAVNNPYTANPFDTWNITIDNATDEVQFTSSEQAKNFTTVLNNIYFDSTSSEIRGLLNVKTNIEILTLESQESGDSDTLFTAPKGVDIPSSATTTLTDLEANIQQYDAVFVEYSMQDKSANTATNYKRIGTLHITGESNSNTAIVQDNFTDSRSGYTGNVTFTASYDSAGSVVEITADNTLSPGTDVRLTFIRRSWSTL